MSAVRSQRGPGKTAERSGSGYSDGLCLSFVSFSFVEGKVVLAVRFHLADEFADDVGTGKVLFQASCLGF